MEVIKTFDPVVYSHPELEFLKTAMGKSPTVAFGDGVPSGVNPRQVSPLLQQIKDWEDMGTMWVGIPAVVQCIETYQKVDQEWREIQRRGGPRFPSFFTFDAKGKAHLGGPGSDSGKVKTYFAEDGRRKPIALDLIGDTAMWQAPWTVSKEAPHELIEEPEHFTLKCAICHHTEQYKEDSEASRRAAMARMSKHMKDPKVKEPELHREYKLNVFGS